MTIEIKLSDLLDSINPSAMVRDRLKSCGVCKRNEPVYVIEFYPFSKDIKCLCKGCYESLGIETGEKKS